MSQFAQAVSAGKISVTGNLFIGVDTSGRITDTSSNRAARLDAVQVNATTVNSSSLTAGVLTTTGTLNANTLNISGLTGNILNLTSSLDVSGNLNAASFSNRSGYTVDTTGNVSVPGDLTVNGNLFANSIVSSRNKLSYLISSCHDAVPSGFSAKQQAAVNMVGFTSPPLVSYGASTGPSGVVNQDAWDQIANYMKSIRSDGSIWTGDSIYSDPLFAFGTATTQMINAASLNSIPPSMLEYFGYTSDLSGTWGPILKSSYALLKDKNTDIIINDTPMTAMRNYQEQRGGFSYIWDDHDHGAGNDQPGTNAIPAYTKALWDFGYNSMNGFTKYSIPPEAVTEKGFYRAWYEVLDNAGTLFTVQNIILDDWSSQYKQGDMIYIRDINSPSGYNLIHYDTSGRYVDSCGQRFEYGPSLKANANAIYWSEAQWAWLERTLQVPADLRLINGGEPYFAHLSGSSEIQDFIESRARLVRLLRKYRVDNVIFTGGDVHSISVNRNDEYLPYPLYTIISSGLTKGSDVRAPVDGVVQALPFSTRNPQGSSYYGFVKLDVLMPSTGMVTQPTVRVTAYRTGPPKSFTKQANPLITGAGFVTAITDNFQVSFTYDINISTLKHSSWNRAITPTWDPSGNTFAGVGATYPSGTKISPGDKVRGIVDASGYYIVIDTSGKVIAPTFVNGVQVLDTSSVISVIKPTDLLFELAAYKMDASANFVDSSNVIITDTVFYPPYYWYIDGSNNYFSDRARTQRIDTSGKYIPGTQGKYVLDDSSAYKFWVGITAQDTSSEYTFQLYPQFNQNGVAIPSVDAPQKLGAQIFQDAITPYDTGVYGFVKAQGNIQWDVNPKYFGSTDSTLASNPLALADMPIFYSLTSQMCSVAGYVGQTAKFRFYRTALDGSSNRLNIKTVDHKLTYNNNAVFTNVPGRTAEDMIFVNDQVDPIGSHNIMFHFQSHNYILSMLQYQYGSKNILPGYLYTDDTSNNPLFLFDTSAGQNKSGFPGLTVYATTDSSLNIPSSNKYYSPNGYYKIVFDDSGVRYAYDQYIKALTTVVGGNINIQGTLSNDPVYGNYVVSFNIPYATAQLLAPYEKAFSNAYFDRYPESTLPATPYINTNNFITKAPGNAIALAAGLLKLSGTLSNVNDLPKTL